MQTFEKTIGITVLSYRELTPIERLLLQHACHARLNAQAPYSNYWVGASLIATDGKFSDGCNVENVHYEVVHAEENAICTAVTKLGPFRIAAIAVVGAPAGQDIPWPPLKINSATVASPISSVSDVCPSCGYCLQKIAENCFDETGKFDPNVVLIGYQEETREIYRTTIGDALPMPFLPQHLGINYSKDPRLKKN